MEDNTNWRQAMNVQFADKYWEAAVTEIETLEFMKLWEVVERQALTCGRQHQPPMAKKLSQKHKRLN